VQIVTEIRRGDIDLLAGLAPKQIIQNIGEPMVDIVDNIWDAHDEEKLYLWWFEFEFIQHKDRDLYDSLEPRVVRQKRIASSGDRRRDMQRIRRSQIVAGAEIGSVPSNHRSYGLKPKIMAVR